MAVIRQGSYVMVRHSEKPEPFAALLLYGFTGARGGIGIWQVIDLDNEIVTYAHPSEIIAVLDDRGLQGPDRHPERRPAKPDWEGVATGVVFAQ